MGLWQVSKKVKIANEVIAVAMFSIFTFKVARGVQYFGTIGPDNLFRLALGNSLKALFVGVLDSKST